MIIDFHRTKNKKRQIITEDLEEFLTQSASENEQPEVQLFMQEDTRILLNEIEKLKDRERQVLELKYWADCSNVDIAEILNLTPSNVGIILFRTLEKLKKKLCNGSVSFSVLISEERRLNDEEKKFRNYAYESLQCKLRDVWFIMFAETS